jgi:hypothetical protein
MRKMSKNNKMTKKTFSTDGPRSTRSSSSARSSIPADHAKAVHLAVLSPDGGWGQSNKVLAPKIETRMKQSLNVRRSLRISQTQARPAARASLKLTHALLPEPEALSS